MTSKRKIDWIASFMASYGELFIDLQVDIASYISEKS